MDFLRRGAEGRHQIGPGAQFHSFRFADDSNVETRMRERFKHLLHPPESSRCITCQNSPVVEMIKNSNQQNLPGLSPLLFGLKRCPQAGVKLGSRGRAKHMEAARY